MDIKERVSLAGYMNYRIGGPARYFAAVKTLEDAQEALQFAKDRSIPYFILGGGTNLLMGDNGFEGLVIAMRNSYISSRPNLRKKETGLRSVPGNIFSEKAGSLSQTDEGKPVMVRVDAGAHLGDLVDFALARGLKGTEWAAGIPGQVGGAIRGNAGAFGGEIADAIEEVYALTPEGILKKFPKQHCAFSYRTSIFKLQPGMVVVGALMRLNPADKLSLLKRAEELRAWRRAKHPLEYGNCGSVFKRIDLADVKLGLWKRYPDMRKAVRDGQVATAYFIDECGLKNYRIGDAEVSDKHPNFIINVGKAKAEHVLMVASHVKHEVRRKFGILLEEEPEFII